ncbi:hypothetical protein [Microcoleus sp. Pol12A5]|uniref:hypothetical protein n=1 Tax=Microcoleus sp. Pol12A5 TaxID=3055392 RepID=UPI002FD263DA
MLSISDRLQHQENAGILIVNRHRQMVGVTPNLLRIWQLPELIVRSLSDQLALEFVSEQFENPQLFLKDMREIYEQTHLEINEKVQLRDGRIIERDSQPLWLNGVYVGRLWMFNVN